MKDIDNLDSYTEEAIFAHGQQMGARMLDNDLAMTATTSNELAIQDAIGSKKIKSNAQRRGLRGEVQYLDSYTAHK